MKDKNELTKNKIYIIKKDDDDNDILNIKDYFETVDKFLNINPKISIGAINNQFRKKAKEEQKFSNSENAIKKTRNNRSLKLFRKSNQSSNIYSPKKESYILSYENKDLTKSKNIHKYKLPITDRKNNFKNIHYKFKSFEDLKKIFSSSIQREKESKLKGTNNLIPITTDINVKRKYLNQEKQLKYNTLYKSNSEKYFKNLAKKCKKRESEMLVNNIQHFRMRKQLKEYIENNKLLSEKLGNNYWLFNLRRPTKNDFTKKNYFNIGTKEREIWKRYMDYPDSDVELINLPYHKGKNKIRFITEISKDKNKKELIPKINEFNDIKIEGKNLVIKEYNDIIKTHDNYCEQVKFKVYKDPIENDKNHVKDLIYKEIYEIKKERKNRKKRIKLKLIK